MRFLGNIEAKTDAKGRAFLPAVFRKVLNASGEESLVLRKDYLRAMLSSLSRVCMERTNGRTPQAFESLEPSRPDDLSPVCHRC